MSAGQAKQWEKLVAKLTSPSAPICGIAVKEEKWAAVMEQVQAYKARPSEAFEFLDATAQWAMIWLSEKVKIRTELRNRAWRAWLKEQGKQGGGVHRFVKRTIEAPEKPFLLQGTPTASPQDIADHDLNT